MHNLNHQLNKSITNILNEHIFYDIPVVIGVSWWPDSMYLLHQLKTFWREKWYNMKNIIVVSCNHNTRKNIIEELHWVEQQSVWCTYHTEIYNEDKKSEEYLRNWRHTIFIKYCKIYQSSYLFLWHHLDDRIETTLLNIIRWCGIDGIQAFSTKEQHFLDSNIYILRPLLTISKKEILTECEKLKLLYFIDPTNHDISVSKRNFIRKILWEHDTINNSFERLYNFLDSNNHINKDKNNNKYSISHLQKWGDLINICAWERDSAALYMLFKLYNISINPRHNTLTTLASQLQASGNSIEYQWIKITAYTYWSKIINNKTK